jgi:hypothetical protein
MNGCVRRYCGSRAFSRAPGESATLPTNSRVTFKCTLTINLRSGMTPELARRHAVQKLGGVEPVKEACRDRNPVPFLENFLRDVRFAMRQLRKNPGFTTTAILMLALGICASVAIFAFVDAALIKPLPYRNPAWLLGVFESTPTVPQAAIFPLSR